MLAEVYGYCILKVYVVGRRSGLSETAFSGGALCSCVSKLVIVRSPTSYSKYRPTFYSPEFDTKKKRVEPGAVVCLQAAECAGSACLLRMR